MRLISLVMTIFIAAGSVSLGYNQLIDSDKITESQPIPFSPAEQLLINESEKQAADAVLYPLQEDDYNCNTADLILNGKVGLEDVAILFQHWLSYTCNDFNLWCDGADFDRNSGVDFRDMIILSRCWLAEESEAPATPKWASVNAIVSPLNTYNRLTLTGLPTTDDWFPEYRLQYRFLCTSPGNGPDSGWLDNPNYTFTGGLVYGAPYEFLYLVRDPVGNVSVATQTRVGIPGSQYYPQPDPANPVTNPVMLWAIPPACMNQTRIKMTALTITDPQNFGVEYQYARYIGTLPAGSPILFTVQNYNSTSLPANTLYSTTPWIFTDTGLTENQPYTYEVRCKYNKGPWTNWSEVGTATPYAIEDNQPPQPNPAVMLNAINLIINGIWYHLLVAQEAEDDSDVQYQFECVAGPSLEGANAMWRNVDNVAMLPNSPAGTAQLPNVIWVPVGSQFVRYQYRVRYSDRSTQQNTGQWSQTIKPE